MKRFLSLTFFLAAAWIILHSQDNADDSALTSFGYRFPVVPDSITHPKERAEYLARHFWDTVALKDYDNPVSFNTFLYVVSLTSPEVQKECIDAFLDETFADLDLYSKIAYYLDITIGNAESGLRNDSLYLHAQKHIVGSNLPPEYKTAPVWRISLFEKNKQGSIAKALTLPDETGKEFNLLDLPKPLVVAFAGSECSNCKLELPLLTDRLQDLEANNWTTVIIYVDGKKPGYELPENCYVLYDKDKKILDDDLYLIRRLPSLYVIGDENIILKSECTIEDFLKEFIRN